MKTTQRLLKTSSLAILPALVAALFVAGLDAAQAAPDPATSITNGIATFQGNQANGISGADFQSKPVNTLGVNSLSGPIQPAAGTAGIFFQNSGAGNVTLNAGLSGSNIVINTRNASGIFAESVGAPQFAPPNDPFLGIPIPTNSAVPGGVVRVESHSDVATVGDNTPAISATSRTTGFSSAVIQSLETYTGAGIAFTVTGVTNADGTPGTVGSSVTGTLVDTNGAVLGGSGGSYIIRTDGTFQFIAGTNFNNLVVGQSVQTIADYQVHGDNGKGVTHDTSGTLVTVVTMTTNGLVFNSGAYLGEYGPSTNLTSVLPDLISYSRNLADIAAAGGAGNSVTVENFGTLTNHGVNSFGILAQSAGGNGGRGRDGSISHGSGAGGNGSTGGAVAVNAGGSIATTGDGSVGVVAWSQGGTGGAGGDGGTWRYGAHGGTGGDGGEVDVTGSGTIHTFGQYASGILAVSAGGDGGGGGSGGGVTGGGNGGFGGHGGDVSLNGTWNITTEGDYAHGIWAKSVGGNAGSGGSGGWLAGSPGSGGVATDGGSVSVLSGGLIETLGHDSYGIYAESIGGFGGQGGGQSGIFYSHGGSGSSAGSGGAVEVTQTASGQIVTFGTNSHGIFAQSVGGGGGSGGGAGAIAGVGGTSGAGGFGGTAIVTNYGSITTYGESARGIYAQSVGGGGGDGGSGSGIAGIGGSGAGSSPGGLVTVANFGFVTTTNKFSDAIFAESIGGGGGSAGRSAGLVGIGGSGNAGGNGSNVTVISTGTLQTLGLNSRGIFAQSVGGGGGDGGSSKGLVAIGGAGSQTSDGGVVLVNNNGAIHSQAQAIFAQSIGGGGGNGGSSGGWFSFGGSAGGGGNGGLVTVNNTGSLTTAETNASGIFAQSVGGGGGNGGNSLAVGATVSVALGGKGGAGGDGSQVNVASTSGSIVTGGDQAHGIFAQSVGGGGGNGGYAFSAALGDQISVAVAIGGEAGDGGNASDVSVLNSSAITNLGNNSHGIFAQSVGGGGGSGGFSVAAAGSESGVSGSLSLGGKGGGGGDAGSVKVANLGSIQNYGNHSYGLLAQSVGGGGGDGGFAVAGAFSPGVAASLAIGGSGANGGTAQDVFVQNLGNISTVGDDSHALFAQSVGGGGGSGGFSVAGNIGGAAALGVSLGGSGGGGASAGNVFVTNNAALLTTTGHRAYGVLAQSVGGGGGDGGFSVAGDISKSASVGFGLGGSGSSAGNGGIVALVNSSSIFTSGSNSHALFAQSVGGGGGSGGFSVAGGISADGAAIGVSLGGSGAGGGSASNVTLLSTGTYVTTLGDRSDGILAQSVGGGGGDGGFSVAGSISKGPALDVSIGGKGGAGGAGADVKVHNDSALFTGGQLSYGILAQSVGGGGGAGGFAISGELSAQSSGLAFSLGGHGGNGNSAGDVVLDNSGMVTTTNKGSHALFAQSLGGGGGAGGFAGSLAGGFGDGASLSVALGGKGGAGANAGVVTVTNLGRLTTVGDSASGIYAQSVGGGGGDGGFGLAAAFGTSPKAVDLAVAIGGSGNTGGVASVVYVDNRNAITTYGTNSMGIFAQSIGGGGGEGGFSAAGTLSTSTNAKQLSVSVGGSGGQGNNAGLVVVTNSATIITSGSSSSGIKAQSVGGGGGDGGFSFAGTFSGAGSKSVSISVGGSGGAGGMGSNVLVNNSGWIITSNDNSRGIYAQSVGGGGGDGGASVALNLSTGATNTTSLSVGVSVGGGGGTGQRAGDVQVGSSGHILTYGTNAAGILAQSIGGGGGNGGFALAGSAEFASSGKNISLQAAVGGNGGNGNSGGAVAVDHSGVIETWGDSSQGIKAQSVGGGGGDAGWARSLSLFYGGDTNKSNWAVDLSIGGSGGGSSDGGAVRVTNSGDITTHGANSQGIFAESIGGGGGSGGDANYGSPVPGGTAKFYKSLQITVGGSAGSSGDGADVTVNQSGGIVTTGDNSAGIFAHSIGGGGGEGGAGQLGFTGKVSVGGAGGSAGSGGDVTVNLDGTIDTWGAGAHGILAQSVGGGGGVAGDVTRGYASKLNVGIGLAFGQGGGSAGDGGAVNVTGTGDIYTRGMGAIGILAQSVGGGGGLAGNLGNDLPGLSLLNFAGSVGGAGSGGAVNIDFDGNVITLGDNAHGIFAQSAGGTNGVGGDVSVTVNGSVAAQGNGSDGIFAQSRGDSGNGNISVTVSNGIVHGGSGDSAGVRLADGARNTLNNFGTITTLSGISGTALVAGAGNDAVENYGLMTSSIDLGVGTNAFNNRTGGRLESGGSINLGRGSQFLNAGTFAPGGQNAIQSTALTGNYSQTGNGVFEVKLGAPGVSDSLSVNGSASLDGTLSVSRFNGFLPRLGDEFTVLTASDGVSGRFVALEDPLKGNYALQLRALYEPTQASLLTMQDSFVQFAHTPNQVAVARNLNSFSGFLGDGVHGDPRGTNLIAVLDTIPGRHLPLAFDLIAPEELGSLFDIEFGSVDAISGTVQRRMEGLRGGNNASSGYSLFQSGAAPIQLAYAAPGLPPMSAPAPQEDWEVFGAGYGQFVDVNSSANAAGYALNNAGAVIGLDKTVNQRFAAGLSAAYLNGSASLVNGGSVEMQGGHAGLYASWFNPNAYLEGQLGGGAGRFDTRRFALGGFASGSTSGCEADAMLGTGYNLRHGGLTTGVLGELHYTHVSLNSFEETGSLAPLQVANNRSDSLWTLIGGRVAYDWQIAGITLAPEVRVGWRHELLDEARNIDSHLASGAGGIFTVQSPSLGRDSLSLITGVSARLAQRLSLFAYYDGQLTLENASSHTVNGGLSFEF